MNSGKASTAHQLIGLEADSLLAFLAVLGLLRALDAARPEWAARVAWRGTPPMAELRLASGASAEQVITEVDNAIRKLSYAYNFDKVDLRQYTMLEFRKLAQEAIQDRERALLISALASDAVEDSDSEKRVYPRATILCALGTGKTGTFLERLRKTVRGGSSTEADESPSPEHARPKRGRRPTRGQRETRSDQLHRALFEPWRYDEKGLKTFRWDPSEDRRHAYQFGDPSEGRNKIGTVSGANRLAAIGLAKLTSAPTTSALVTLGVSGETRSQSVCWPLVGVPTGLSGHVAALAHPWLGDEQRAPGLAHYGVLGVARSRRYGVRGTAGTYFNSTRARVQFL